ncbi:MAG: hypothetical protein P4L38_02405 [Syntrophaceae bacterium]|nr:hypothetical protein [Syntrophaceae bacterium]
MEYKHVNGQAYCRYAATPPIINSPLADQYGIEVFSPVSVEEGRYVKLRVVLQDRPGRITCHARIDYAKRVESGNQYRVGFSHLSLTDEEFRLLLQSFVDESERVLELTESVRDKGAEAPSVTGMEGLEKITRIKAVTLSVSLIEEIDMKRGDESFSDFVAKAVRDYVKR